MTSSVGEKFSYFVRVSFYNTEEDGGVLPDKKIRAARLIVECPPLRRWDDVVQHILPEFAKMCIRENEFIDVESIVPVSWPQTSYMVLGSPGTGKTGGAHTMLNTFETNKVKGGTYAVYQQNRSHGQLGQRPCVTLHARRNAYN